MTEPFDARELIELRRGLERRGIPYDIAHRRTAKHCDGIAVRIQTGFMEIWEVGFFDYGHIEVLKFVLPGDVQTGITAASLLADLDAKKAK